MEQEHIKFEKFTLSVFPKSNMSFRIHKGIEGLDISQKCILDNLCNAKSDIQKLEALNILSFHFKQLNDNLDIFSNLSSSDMHCLPIDTNFESLNYRKITEKSKVAFSKSFQNESPKLYDENLDSKIKIFIFQTKEFKSSPRP